MAVYKPGAISVICILATTAFAVVGGMAFAKEWLGLPSLIGALGAAFAIYATIFAMRLDGYNNGYEEGRFDERNGEPDRRT